MLAAMRSLFPALAALVLALPTHAQTGTVYIPKAIELPGTTAAEKSANDVWNLRAALNVAALQCQFSPFLRTVPRYNALIKQHAREFTRAQTALQGYFKRTGGKTAATGFDRYNTRLYQSYSTMDAQLGFCRASSDAGYDALAQRFGRLAEVAGSEVAAIRFALTPVGEHFLPFQYATLPDLSAGLVCGERDRRKARC